MSRTVQERALESSATRRLQLKLEHPVQGINALDLQASGDKNQVVIAGRNVFKIFKLEDHSFIEKLDLRVGKINLNLSCTDVVWHPSQANILASCATNGAVVTWNLDHMRRSKQDKVFTDHSQTATKVCFHPKEPNILFSGSNDQTVRTFDLRQPLESACVSVFKVQDRVRYVEYDPHNYFTFASATDTGNLLLWDLRKTDKSMLSYPTHSGPSFGIAWHPEETNWLATCGRDKTIKIWSWDGHSKYLTQEHVINTFAPVSNIKWRTQRKHHITSCSLAIDTSIYVWDIRRPFVPLAMFDEHKDVVTGLAWRDDSHTFISGGKDSMLIQHVFKDGKKAEENSSPVGIGMNIYGTICQAVCKQVLKKDTVSSSYQNTRRPMIFRRQDAEPQAKDFDSKILVYETIDDKFPEIFMKTAKLYKLRGLPFEQLCEHNANVSRSLSRHQVTQTWLMLKLFYIETSNTMKKPVESFAKSTAGENHLKGLFEAEKVLNKPSDKKSSLTNVTGLDSTTGITSDESQSDSEVDPKFAVAACNHKQNHQQGGYFFQESEDDEEYGDIQGTDGPDEFDELPSEAFLPRHELIDRPPSPTLSKERSRPESPVSAEEAEVCNAFVSKLQDSVIPSYKPNFSGPQLMARCQPIIVDMLKFYAEQGDVQMSVSALIVLQDRIRGEIDDEMQEHWFTSYIDLLHRFKLYTCANDIIKLCKLEKVGSMNQLSTVIYTKCNRCQHDLEHCGWACRHCNHQTNTCSICHLPVKGLYAWCQGCSHGGHLSHISDWLKDNKTCPTGCGHMCEYI
ncbi:GATOR complex protein WDR24-like [Anneissia japonica]|uniref:GATOR complex protein WDR24-like n=1 Tax=Anneissia japonica TaxID=1529436 RepID=UPI001425AD7B|nr:GATOR complex protein WDR24-like [Anneissia japonica]